MVRRAGFVGIVLAVGLPFACGGSSDGGATGASATSSAGGGAAAGAPVGAACAKDTECASGLCQGNGHCTAPCATATDCPAGPTWKCAETAAHGAQCQCTPGPEACDGLDDDCDGVPDDGATCAEPGFTCQDGACACTKCDGACANLQTDAAHCGSCETACAPGEVCTAGACAKAPCSPACGALEECAVLAGGQGLCVAKSVPLPHGYAIDATEVTQAQYAAWLATKPATSGQPKACAWNTELETNCGMLEGGESLPIRCVDWCDAYAYCAAVGKRMCGAIGGGPSAWGDYASASKDQWFAACSSGGKYAYPYGASYVETACNTTGEQMVEVGSLSTCQSPVAEYAGVYDLAGNLFEWVDSCETEDGAKDRCRSRGGSFGGPPTDSLCNGPFQGIRDDMWVGQGMRCCSK